MIFWKKLSTAGNRCRPTACLKGQGNKLADSTFMCCGSLLVVLDMAWRAKILVKFTNILCMSSFVIKCDIGTCFGHKGAQNLKILRIYQTGSLTRDIIHYTKCAKIQQILVRPEYIQCFIAWLEERSVIEVRYNHIGNCLPVVQR